MFDRIKKDMIVAMKAKQKERLSVIRMIKAAVDQERIDKKCEVTDDMVMDILLKQVKMREDSITEFKKANREDLVKANEQEIAILKEYLPMPLSEEEIDNIIDDAIQKIKPTGMSDMGKVMAIVTPQVKGKGNMKDISMKIKEKLN